MTSAWTACLLVIDDRRSVRRCVDDEQGIAAWRGEVVPLRLHVNDYWEGGKCHPFVGVGAGRRLCSCRTKDPDGHSIGESEMDTGLFDIA